MTLRSNQGRGRPSFVSTVSADEGYDTGSSKDYVSEPVSSIII